jgi:hypothetical protein
MSGGSGGGGRLFMSCARDERERSTAIALDRTQCPARLGSRKTLIVCKPIALRARGAAVSVL